MSVTHTGFFLIPWAMRCNYLHSINIVFGCTSHLDLIEREDVQTLPFYIRDLSMHGFWRPLWMPRDDCNGFSTEQRPFPISLKEGSLGASMCDGVVSHEAGLTLAILVNLSMWGWY
jgi:hypothetical protein